MLAENQLSSLPRFDARDASPGVLGELACEPWKGPGGYQHGFEITYCMYIFVRATLEGRPCDLAGPLNSLEACYLFVRPFVL